MTSLEDFSFFGKQNKLRLTMHHLLTNYLMLAGGSACSFSKEVKGKTTFFLNALLSILTECHICFGD